VWWSWGVGCSRRQVRQVPQCCGRCLSAWLLACGSWQISNSNFNYVPYVQHRRLSNISFWSDNSTFSNQTLQPHQSFLLVFKFHTDNCFQERKMAPNLSNEKSKQNPRIKLKLQHQTTSHKTQDPGKKTGMNLNRAR
jgi:hypothetical protein